MVAARRSMTSMPTAANIGRSSRSLPSLRVASSTRLRCGSASLSQCTPLRRVDLAQPASGKVQQAIEITTGESAVLTGALHFDKTAFAAHHDVHVDVGCHVLGIVEIEPRLATQQADA